MQIRRRCSTSLRYISAQSTPRPTNGGIFGSDVISPSLPCDADCLQIRPGGKPCRISTPRSPGTPRAARSRARTPQRHPLAELVDRALQARVGERHHHAAARRTRDDGDARSRARTRARSGPSPGPSPRAARAAGARARRGSGRRSRGSRAAARARSASSISTARERARLASQQLEHAPGAHRRACGRPPPASPPRAAGSCPAAADGPARVTQLRRGRPSSRPRCAADRRPLVHAKRIARCRRRRKRVRADREPTIAVLGGSDGDRVAERDPPHIATSAIAADSAMPR